MRVLRLLRGLPRIPARTMMFGVTAGVTSATIGAGAFAEGQGSSANKPPEWYMKPWTSFQKEPAMADQVPGYDRVHVLRRTFYSVHLMGRLRDASSSREQFIDAARKLSVMILNEALGMLPHTPRSVKTPVDNATYVTFDMPDPHQELCVVHILRAASSMSDVVTREYPEIPVGTILIQRNEETAEPVMFYSKLPPDVEKRRVILVDPMLATGGSIKEAIATIRKAGVLEQNILVVSIVAAPEGVDAVLKANPTVRILVGEMDRGLNDKKYIVPGLGDFGDRFYGTT
mmetsp:Transcript_23647/g.57406  ORF Transcript_23647/g.57406 Transcript_23647/m.57406 type:complete len:287 (-) Transcript_23647:16-876(-)